MSAARGSRTTSPAATSWRSSSSRSSEQSSGLSVYHASMGSPDKTVRPSLVPRITKRWPGRTLRQERIMAHNFPALPQPKSTPHRTTLFPNSAIITQPIRNPLGPHRPADRPADRPSPCPTSFSPSRFRTDQRERRPNTRRATVEQRHRSGDLIAIPHGLARYVQDIDTDLTTPIGVFKTHKVKHDNRCPDPRTQQCLHPLLQAGGTRY